MHKQRIVVCLCLFFALSTGIVYGQDNGLTLPILVDGETITTAFDTTAGAQLYAFNGSAGDLVSVLVEQPRDSVLDPIVVLLDEVGYVVAANDDTGNPERTPLAAEVVDVELPNDGTYFVLAMTIAGLLSMDYGESADAPYTVEVTASGFSLPSNREADTLRYAGIIATYNTPLTLTLSREAPVFYVSFDGEAGDEIDLVTRLGGGEGDVIDSLLYLFAPDGQRIAANDDPEEGVYAAELRGIELPVDGRYVVFASSYLFHAIDYLEDELGGTWVDGDFEMEISH
jgi:hypothetical protein